MKKRYAALLCAAVVLLVLVVNAPAAWLAPLVKHYSQGTVSFAQSWGTVWRGNAMLTLHRSDKEVLNVPQALAWTLDVSQLFSLSAQLILTSPALQAPVSVDLSPSTVGVAAGHYSLPADSLSSMGAPFNTLKPTGDIALRWQAFEILTANQTPPSVPLTVTVKALRMALTGADVLGDYVANVTPQAGKRWAITLATSNPNQAALLLTGKGQLGLNDAPQFELESKAANPQAQMRLQTLLNFLGRRQDEVYVLKIN
jgi:general secretion pathway protein N